MLPRIRRSINNIWKEYVKGVQTNNPALKRPLEDIVRAFQGIYDISKKDPDHPNSFFKIGGYHGEPFRGAGYANPGWWGGYCHHGNVLFPTWHRAYCLRLEDALRSIPGCEDVTLPFWDETGSDTAINGVPGIFLLQQFELDGVTIPNPLYSYEFPKNIVDRVDQDPNSPTFNLYTKHKGYKTVRYPYSGLVGTEKARADTKAHNDSITPEEAVEKLNTNVKNWLNHSVEIDKKPFLTGTRNKFSSCLQAPNYTVFSNLTSSQAWNDERDGTKHVVALESPHNDIHLAVGGFDVPTQGDRSPYAGANGDMGENDTAGLDPIFFFHHCEIDRYFWLWQQGHWTSDKINCTQKLELISEYPGTNSVDSQGPTPGVPGGVWLTLETELQPFKNASGQYLTSSDVVNILELGYNYEIPANFIGTLPEAVRAESSVRISGVNKNSIAGSYVLAVYATQPGQEKKLIGAEAVLSRWNVTGCANCQVQSASGGHRYVPLIGVNANTIGEGDGVQISVEVIQRTGPAPAGFADPPVPSIVIVKPGQSYQDTI